MIIPDANLLHVHVDCRRRWNIQRRLWLLIKRRAAIEPMIGLMRSEHRSERMAEILFVLFACPVFVRHAPPSAHPDS
jgi:hypothetical protein